ncbi:glycosyltransferase family A protein [Yoonia sp. I 8.24]|uniref:glycosyltransferase family A protein n=1 Tax=Yoonia sp. I 8.24 TaxID=1537229 RepID=UPI001EE007AA|nr:glycosyltransferase family A protein [Yoonia sp. I 8.24]MCG3267598.1 glycosyltransferase family 2 protein [Yoonia sp. I 8.24]
MTDVLVVGAITRARPEMFRRLLASFAAMKRPEGIEIVFVFAENAEALSIEHDAETLRDATGCQCELLIEPRLGIPFARNAVLSHAVERDAKYLVFVDDDEWVSEDWLVNLYKGFAVSGDNLATGPISPQYIEDQKLSWVQRRLIQGVTEWYARARTKNCRNVARGESHRIGAATNNWICDLDFVRRTGLRFDDDIGLGGGSDTAFWRDLQKLGGSSTWIDDALVFDTVPISRLSMSYQFKRGRDQTAAEWLRRKRGGGLTMFLRSLPFITNKATVGTFQSVYGLIIPGPHLTFGLRKLGAAFGRVSAVSGRYGAHYEKLHGS